MQSNSCLVQTLAIPLVLTISFASLGCRNEQADAPPIEPTLTSSVVQPTEATQGGTVSPEVDDGSVKTITYDDLKLEIEKGALFEESLLTPEIEGLFGRRISIRGFMFPTFQQQGIEQFVLLQQKDCPFGTPEGYVHHAIYVKLKEGVSTSFTRDPLEVAGVLSLDPKKSSRLGREFHIAIYRLDEAEVR